MGYVLVELLSGISPFKGIDDPVELILAKQRFIDELPRLLPSEVLASESLMHLIKTLIQPDALARFPSTEAADLLAFAATNFQRELVVVNLAGEYAMEIRHWLQELS